jgi:hypothetical protein
LRFADVIADLKERYRADLENIERRRPTDAEMAAWITQMALGVPSAPYKGKDRLTDDDIDRRIAETEICVEALFDGIAKYLARGFYAETLPFRFCDAIINELEMFSLRGDSAYAAHAKNGPRQGPSKLLWDIYLAFDAGEYRRQGDDRDPIAAFTRPAIAEIVEANSGFRYPDDSI